MLPGQKILNPLNSFLSFSYTVILKPSQVIIPDRHDLMHDKSFCDSEITLYHLETVRISTPSQSHFKELMATLLLFTIYFWPFIDLGVFVNVSCMCDYSENMRGLIQIMQAVRSFVL